MNFTVIFLAIFAIILIYLLYQYFTAKNITLAKQVNLNIANPPIVISTNPQSYRYTYSLWLNINTWDNKNYKPIFYRNYNAGVAGNSNSAPSPFPADPNFPTTLSNAIMLYLDKTTPTLFFQIPETAVDTYQPYNITLNFPLQTWTYIAISVDSNYIDFYINGKLIKSVQMGAQPIQPSAATFPIYTGTGWDGQISQFTYQNGPISPQDAWTAFLSGSGVSGASSAYNVNVDIMKNSQVQSTYTLY